MQNKHKIILGIDPGSIIMGYGAIEIKGNSVHLIEMDVFKIGVSNDAYKKLELIHEKVCQLISTIKPDAFAIEAPFFGKNVQSMLKLGRAQGVAIAAAMQSKIPVWEYAPKKVKQSITGNGNARKEQVLNMLQQLLKFNETPHYFDASDALAVAVCHYFQQTAPISSLKSEKSWKAFIAANPDRIISGNKI